MHPGACSALSDFLPALDDALPGLVEGLYVHGSVARDSYDERTSDLDVTAVLARPPSPHELEALARVHGSRHRVEGEYLVAGAWGEEHDAFNEGRHERWRLSVVNRTQLREHAIVLRGPHPSTFLEPATRAELLAEMRWNLDVYWPGKLRERRLWLSEVWTWFGVLTLGRILYTLETGETISKPEARAWLRDRHPEWAPLLDDRLGRLRRALAARRFVRERIAEGRRLLARIS